MTRFLQFVEIKTKITSVFPFFFVLAVLFAAGQTIQWGLTALFFAAMFLFDLVTTAINNYIDTKDNGLPLPVSRRAGLWIIVCLLAVSSALGLWLAVLTGPVVLLFGLLCFACGVLYTWGPLPISRIPLGEAVSGLFYGIIIPFLLFFINLPAGALLDLRLSAEQITLRLEVRPLFAVFLLGIAPFCATANIMLANNICDKDRDVRVGRYTLAYYMRGKAMGLFAALALLPYAAAAALVLFGVLSWPYLMMLLTIFPVAANIKAFFKKQEKQTTFICSIRIYVLQMAAAIAGALLSALA